MKIFLLPFFFIFTISIAPLCDVCHHFVGLLRKSVHQRPILPILEKIAVQYCVSKHMEDKQVCEGAIKEMAPFLIPSLWRHQTNPHVTCQNIKMCKKEYINRNLTNDIQKTLRGKPTKTWENPTKRRILKIMHISDSHPDLFYTPGAIVDCKEPVCCRANVTAKSDNSQKAGYWGSIGTCDLPLQTFQVFLKQVSKMYLDAIIWTGDNTPHDVWQQTQSYNLNYTNLLAERIRNHTNATVIPAMGNHESWPVNVYDYRRDREDTLKAGLAQSWRFWMDENAMKMQREKGYFKMVYPKLNNLKVLSINTQAGNNMNWFLLQDPSDPGNTLEWLESQLKQSEKDGQMTYLVGHIPPLSNLNDWAMRFNAIVDRYSYVIRGQFYGHTHADHLSFFPNFSSKKDISTAQLSNFYFVAPSITTYSDRTPEYRIMDVDYDTLQVVDYSQYRLDIRKYTSQSDRPIFDLLYSFKKTYGIDDMTVKGGMTEFRNKLRDEPETQKLFTYLKSGGLSNGKSGKQIFCNTMSAPQFQSECNGETWQKSQFQKAAGPWREFLHKNDQ